VAGRARGPSGQCWRAARRWFPSTTSAHLDRLSWSTTVSASSQSRAGGGPGVYRSRRAGSRCVLDPGTCIRTTGLRTAADAAPHSHWPRESRADAATGASQWLTQHRAPARRLDSAPISDHAAKGGWLASGTPVG
jgi:hypothetical protein